MKKLYEILGQRAVKGDVGIEIEMEGNDFPEDVDARWVATEDGSLRGENREYVFRKPLPVAECKPVLTVLEKALKDAGTVLNFSFRTSVHVHVNCQDLTYVQYLNYLYTYLLLEEPLMTFCGKERKGNRFCLRLQDAEGMLDTLHNMFSKHEEGFAYIPPDQVRYSAMNIEATKKFGSLEFRGMSGCMDVERIDTWANALVYMREFARSCASPSEVYQKYAQLEAQGFIEAVLKEYAIKFYYPRMVRDIQQSFSLSIDLPFAYGDAVKVKEEAVAEKDAYQKALDEIRNREAKRMQEFVQVNMFGAPAQAVPAPRPRPAARVNPVKIRNIDYF